MPPATPQLVPRHIAITMDGNGRWAAARGAGRADGHRQGAEAVRRVVRAARELDIPYLTLYAFSAQNWQRPAGEVIGFAHRLPPSRRRAFGPSAEPALRHGPIRMGEQVVHVSREPSREMRPHGPQADHELVPAAPVRDRLVLVQLPREPDEGERGSGRERKRQRLNRILNGEHLIAGPIKPHVRIRDTGLVILRLLRPGAERQRPTRHPATTADRDFAALALDCAAYPLAEAGQSLHGLI